ncbi:hypothetical protein T265_04249 [Opisthorchis viverrini]|uniref:Uncharacterized protein n=1 Tax=Opisthorchis viverrini TaxID=6198 RepID=A0A075A0I9_OPIVI|nr:hypothetical protein T265_04249 [Opisthorchis viverrini]KER29065.1 hypothetical protein T265_04249 [Opisthorchis viverrini]
MYVHMEHRFLITKKQLLAVYGAPDLKAQEVEQETELSYVGKIHQPVLEAQICVSSARLWRAGKQPPQEQSSWTTSSWHAYMHCDRRLVLMTVVVQLVAYISHQLM